MDKKERANLIEQRPWGGFIILEEQPTHKVKRIWVNPGHRLSYQKHRFRSEHWIIITGDAKVTLDGNEIFLNAGDSIDIPIGSAHRIENIGKEILNFIEVQRGKEFSEDDVIRLEDDYGRANVCFEVGSL
jgi:mannose-6-phosphate isomerase-like protein (cupin superfamily)